MPTKPKTLAGELWSLAKSFSRVMAGYVLLILTVVVVRFPYHTDPVGERSVARPANYAEYYAGVYALPKQGKGSATEDSSDGRYVKMARDAIADQHVTQRLTEFVSLFGLERARILDVGSGTGYLQDVVENYVGLDISPTAARYYHKPFIEASATNMPIPDNDFDAAWSIWVLEHVPVPEQALLEIRRVVKDGGLIFMVPAWNVYPWAADGYPVRPFGDLNLKGKLAKAGMFAVEYKPLAQAVKMITRASLGTRALFGGPTHLHYNPLTPNYEKYWMQDSDAINSLDRYEMQLWFTSRGDECLNCQGGFWEMTGQLMIRVHKGGGR